MTIGGLLFILSIFCSEVSAQLHLEKLIMSNIPGPSLASLPSVLLSSPPELCSSFFSPCASFDKASFTSSRLFSSGMTSSRVFWGFSVFSRFTFGSELGEVASALRLVPLAGVADGGLELLLCAATRAD